VASAATDNRKQQAEFGEAVALSVFRALISGLFLVIRGVLGLWFGPALGFRGERSEELLFRKLAVQHVFAGGFLNRLGGFGLVDLGMTLQTLDIIFPELIGLEGFDGDFAQGDHGILVPVPIDQGFSAPRQLPATVSREQYEVETVWDFVHTIFNGNARHPVLILGQGV
jgi:hypothetical protein